MGQIQSISEFIGLIIRRRLLIGAITVFGVVITMLYVIAKPDVFESAAVIQVQSPRVAETDAPGATSGSAQRLQAIEQQLTTRENMIAVIERHGLYTDLPLTDDEKVHLLRTSVRFQTVASVAATSFGAPAQVSALIVFAQSDTREKAARIANDFAQSVLDAGATGQSNRAREALVFFQGEETRLRDQIRAQEALLAIFKNENADALPTLRDQRQQELTGLETEKRALDQAIVAAQSERTVIEKKANLRETDRRQIATLSNQLDTLDQQSAALQDRRTEIMAALARTPDVERSLAEYERNLAQLQSQFDVVTRRVADADTAQKLEDRQQGESFALLERAVEPDYPISGGRRKLALVGAIASLLQGIGIAFVLDFLNPVLRTKAQLERELDLVAIVAIPEVPHLTAKRRGFLPEASTLMDKLPPLTSILPKGLVSAGGTQPGALTRQQSIAGGLAVILLVVSAATIMA